jgi:hypothetical protein
MPNVTHLDAREKAAAWKGQACADAVVEQITSGNYIDGFKALIDTMDEKEQELWRYTMAGYTYRLLEHIFQREVRLRQMQQEGLQ